MVLEPLPGRDVRRRVVHLPAAARGARLRPEGEVHRGRRRSSSTAGPSAGTSASTTARCSRPRSPALRWDDDARALDRVDQPRRRAARPLRVHGQRSAAPARSCRASPASRRSAGHSFHTSRWDYDYTGGDSDGEPHRPARQAGRHHRHRRDGGAVRARTSARRPSSCTCSSARRRRSTCATTARPIPSGRPASSRAGSGGGWRTSTTSSPACFEPEDLVDDGWTDIIGKLLLQDARGRRRRHQPGRPRRAPSSWPTSRRWSRSAARVDAIVDDPATAEALKPYYRQFCKRPCFHDEYLDASTGPTSRSSTPTAGASTGSPSAASSSATPSTSSTA